MALSPLEIQKTRFTERRRGYDPVEVENFLALVAEELTARLAEIERLERESRLQVERLRDAEEREHKLQETLVRGQRVAEEIIANAQKEAQLTTKEAELNADKLTQQALERVTELERRVQELRLQRVELRLRFRNTLEMYRQLLDVDPEDEPEQATVNPVARTRRL